MFLSYHLISLRIILFVKTLEKHKQEDYRLLEKHTAIVVSFLYVPSLLTFPPFFPISYFLSLCTDVPPPSGKIGRGEVSSSDFF